jgi:hypothetical protein
MKKKSKNLTTLDKFIDKYYGKPGNTEREVFEAGYENFQIGFLLQEARFKKGISKSDYFHEPEYNHFVRVPGWQII